MFWYDGELFDGKEISLTIDNPGLLYGASVFTTMRVFNADLDHPLSYWQAHNARLLDTLKSFGWMLPEREKIRCGAEVISRSFPVIRIAIFPDGKEWIIGRNLPPNLELEQRLGVVGRVSDNPIHRRYCPEYKTGNYLGAWLAYGDARKSGAREAILVDDSGNWSETSTGNLWGWYAGRWYTPVLNMLPGIGRYHWSRVMESNSIPFREIQWTAELIGGMEAIAFSNSVVGLIPFREILWGDRTLILDPTHESIRELRTLSELMS